MLKTAAAIVALAALTALASQAQPAPPGPGITYNDFSGAYGADKPVLLRGTLTAVNRQSGGALMTVNVDGGQVYTVSGNAAGGEALSARIGQTVIIRGYASADGACCRATARDFTLADGTRVMATDNLTGPASAGATTLSAAGRPLGAPAAAPAGPVILQSPLTNAVVREGQER